MSNTTSHLSKRETTTLKAARTRLANAKGSTAAQSAQRTIDRLEALAAERQTAELRATLAPGEYEANSLVDYDGPFAISLPGGYRRYATVRTAKIKRAGFDAVALVAGDTTRWVAPTAPVLLVA